MDTCMLRKTKEMQKIHKEILKLNNQKMIKQVAIRRINSRIYLKI